MFGDNRIPAAVRSRDAATAPRVVIVPPAVEPGARPTTSKVVLNLRLAVALFADVRLAVALFPSCREHTSMAPCPAGPTQRGTDPQTRGVSASVSGQFSIVMAHH